MVCKRPIFVGQPKKNSKRVSFKKFISLLANAIYKAQQKPDLVKLIQRSRVCMKSIIEYNKRNEASNAIQEPAFIMPKP